MPALDIDLERDVQDGAIRRIYQEFRVALVGSVQTFKRSTSRAVLELMTRFQGTDGKPHSDPPAVDVPIIHQSGDGYGLWHDVTENDLAVVVCCDGPVRGVFETGSAVTPTTAASHTYGCAVAFPGGRVSNTVAPTQPPNDPGTGLSGAGDKTACVVYRRAGHPLLPGETGTVVISAAGPTASIKAGSDAAAIPVACAPQVLANLADLNARIQTWVPVLNDGGASLKPILAAWVAALQDMADAKLVVEGPLAP